MILNKSLPARDILKSEEGKKSPSGSKASLLAENLVYKLLDFSVEIIVFDPLEISIYE